jgi:hypothetical protein
VAPSRVSVRCVLLSRANLGIPGHRVGFRGLPRPTARLEHSFEGVARDVRSNLLSEGSIVRNGGAHAGHHARAQCTSSRLTRVRRGAKDPDRWSQARWPLPCPPWPWDPPGLRGHSIGWHRTCSRYGDRSLVCVRRCSTTAVCTVIVCIVVDPTRLWDCSRCPTLPAPRYGCPRYVTVRSVVRRLVRVSKDRPFTVSGAEESTPTCTSPCLLRRPVANRSRVPPSWFSTTMTAYSSSTLSGCCTRVPVMGFVAFRAARRRSPRHEVLPFEALILVHSGLPEDGEPSWRRADVTQRVSPLVHRLPCPLVLVAWTSRLCSVCEAVSRAVLPPTRDRCSHGLVRLPVPNPRGFRSTPLSQSISCLADLRRLKQYRSG